jgi:hypothetical protein
MTIENDRTDTMTCSGDVGRPRTGTSPGGGTMESAKAEAGQVAGTAKEAGREVMGEVSHQTTEVAATAKQELYRLRDQASTEIRNVSRDRSEQFAGRLETMAQQVRALCEGRVDEAGDMRNWLQQAEQRMQHYASTLRERGPDGMLNDVRRFARRRPGMFLFAASVTGFAIGRAVRAGALSSQSDSGQPRGYTTNGTYSAYGNGTENLGMPSEYRTVTAVVVEGDESLPPPVTGIRTGMGNT